MPGSMKIIQTLFFIFFSISGQSQPLFSPPIKIKDINSVAEESLPLYLNSGLYFVRSFYEKNAGGIEGGQDIWYSEKISDEFWEKPINNFPLFNNRDNNAVIGMSEDGKTIYLMNSYHQAEEKSIWIEMSEKVNGEWGIPKRLILKDVKPEGKFSGFYMHPSEKILMISMQVKNKVHEDLFVCTRDHLGRWSKPINLGSTINTNGFEISPFLSADTKTLYFASNGRADSKNADIYYADRLDNSWQNWSEPVRLPEGINSEAFDAYFSITSSDEVYFVSNREGEYTDIYFAKVTGDFKEPEISSIEQPKSISPETSLNRKDPKAFQSKGSSYIYFEFASAELSEEMTAQLKFVATELKDESNYQIELYGFADDLGPDGYNRILSRKRAESVKTFLINEGLNSQKIIPVGKGKIQLKENEMVDDQRQQNRRVEVVILK